MQKLGPAQSPVVQQTWKKRQSIQRKKYTVTLGLISLLLALVFYIDIMYGSTRIIMCDTMHLFFWYLEASICVGMSSFFLFFFVSYVRFLMGSKPVEINTFQRKLLAVAENEPGFVTPQRSHQTPKSNDPGLIISPTYHQTPYSPTNPPFSPTSMCYTPLQSPHSPNRSLSPGHYSAGASFMNNSSFMATPMYDGYNSSLNRSSVLSPGTPGNSSSMFPEDSSLGLRSRLNHSLKHSPLKSEDCIKDKQELQEFLREQEEKDRKQAAGSLDLTSGSGGGGGSSFWNYNRSLVDCFPMLRKYSYQLACRSPTSTKVKDDDTDDGPTHYQANEVWLKVGVSVDNVDVWIEHLRKWLGSTVMNRLVKEIETVNDSLRRHGAEDMLIGELSISQLKQLAVAKAQQVPTLNTLLPFLEVSANQEYLYNRIMELGSRGCMSDFRWNSGSEFKGKPWAENLPTDAQIVMHMLCSYMDARLPGHPKYYGKTFSTRHFLQTPDKPDLEKKDNMMIYQSKMNPPHYKVVLGDDIWNLPKGRNNMFMAILLFLHHVKEKHHGMLGRVNLGLSGINVLWILETHL